MKMKHLKQLIIFVFLFIGVNVVAASNLGYDRLVGSPHASRSEVIATHGMAATSQPLATQIAIDILKAGGSAVEGRPRLAPDLRRANCRAPCKRRRTLDEGAR